MNSAKRSSKKSLQILTLAVAVLGLVLLSACRRVAVITYHCDNLRTGGDENERKLKPSNVNAYAKDGSMFLLSRDEEKVLVEGALSSAPFVFAMKLS